MLKRLRLIRANKTLTQLTFVRVSQGGWGILLAVQPPISVSSAIIVVLSPPLIGPLNAAGCFRSTSVCQMIAVAV